MLSVTLSKILESNAVANCSLLLFLTIVKGNTCFAKLPQTANTLPLRSKSKRTESFIVLFASARYLRNISRLEQEKANAGMYPMAHAVA